MNRTSAEVRIGWSGILASFFIAMTTAVMTGCLLLINGSIVLLLLNSTVSLGQNWLNRPGFLQFILFCVPLVMVVFQWMAWDLFRRLFVDGSE